MLRLMKIELTFFGVRYALVDTDTPIRQGDLFYRKDIHGSHYEIWRLPDSPIPGKNISGIERYKIIAMFP